MKEYAEGKFKEGDYVKLVREYRSDGKQPEGIVDVSKWETFTYTKTERAVPVHWEKLKESGQKDGIYYDDCLIKLPTCSQCLCDVDWETDDGHAWGCPESKHALDFDFILFSN